MNSTKANLESLNDAKFWPRVSITLLLGVVIAGFLTWFMHALIESSQQELDNSLRANLLDFVRVKRDESSVRKKIKPQRPAMDEAPPAPPAPQTDQQNLADTSLLVSLPKASSNVNVELGGLNIDMSDGEYLPIVKIAPSYPQKAMLKSIEGSCLVEYTVTVTGATKDVRTVEGECLGVFARSAIIAARKFKYKPRVIDGKTVEVPNVFNRFDFKMSKMEEK